MTDAQTYFIGIHGVSKERQDRGDTEVIPRADADRQTQEAVAAVLMEAAKIARAAPDGEIAYDDILAHAAEIKEKSDE